MSAPKDRIPSLDGLRAISIGLVLFGHLCGTRGFPFVSIGKQDLGHLGVKVFFVISGFLITKLLVEEQRAAGRISLWKFYMRRCWRIFPACYAFIATLAVASAVGLIQLRPNDLSYACTYLTNHHFDRSWFVGHLWSLAVEEQFYWVWPGLLVLAGLRRGLIWAAVGFFTAPLLRIIILYKVPSFGPGNGMMAPTVADALAIGCMLALGREWLEQRNWYMRVVRSRWLALSPVLILALNYPIRTSVSMTVQEFFLNLVIAVTIDHCIRQRYTLLNIAPMVWVGEISYSLYLWQQPFLNRESPGLWTSFPLSVLLALAMACASFYIIEKPCRKLGKRTVAGSLWSSRVSRPATTQSLIASVPAPD